MLYSVNVMIAFAMQYGLLTRCCQWNQKGKDRLSKVVKDITVVRQENEKNELLRKFGNENTNELFKTL